MDPNLDTDMEQSFNSRSSVPSPSDTRKSSSAAIRWLKVALGLVLIVVLLPGGAVVGSLIGTAIGRAYCNIDRWDDITAGVIGMVAGGTLGLVIGLTVMVFALMDE